MKTRIERVNRVASGINMVASGMIVMALLGLGIDAVTARPAWRTAGNVDRAYCAAVQGALGADLGVHHHPSLDFNRDGYTDGSDLSYFAARTNDYAWCRSVLAALAAETTPAYE